MDIIGAFDHVFRVKLAQKMAALSIYDDLIGWIKLFLSDR